MKRDDCTHWANFRFERDGGEEHRVECTQCGWVAVETSDLNGIELLLPQDVAKGICTAKFDERGIHLKLPDTCPQCGAKMRRSSRRIHIYTS